MDQRKYFANLSPGKANPVRGREIDITELNTIQDSLTELPTKQLLIQAGYNERDLKQGIDYMESGTPLKNRGLRSSSRKYIKNVHSQIGHAQFHKPFRNQSVNGDLKDRRSLSKRGIETSQKQKFERQYKLRMQKISDDKLNSTTFATRANSRLEYNFPDVTIDNLGSFGETADEGLRSDAPNTSKNKVLAFSSNYPIKRQFSSKKAKQLLEARSHNNKSERKSLVKMKNIRDYIKDKVLDMYQHTQYSKRDNKFINKALGDNKSKLDKLIQSLVNKQKESNLK